MSLATMVSQLGVAFIETLKIFFLTLIFSIPLGLIVSFGRMSKCAPLRWLTKLYISVMRGTPLMLQLIVVYFGPYYIFGQRITPEYRFTAVIIAFSINYAAYFAEIFRAGIESIPVGQHEAAKVLGYSKLQTFFRIILPQMVKRVLPPVTNETITLVKDTSLAFTLAYAEVFSLAKQISASQSSFMPFLIAGIFYFAANYLVEFVMTRIEKSMDYYK